MRGLCNSSAALKKQKAYFGRLGLGCEEHDVRVLRKVIHDKAKPDARVKRFSVGPQEHELQNK